MKLFFINKYQLWFNTSVKLKGEVINPNILKIARQIIKHLFKKNKKTNLSKINLSLDKKVAVIGIDVGLCNLITLDNRNIFGKSYIISKLESLSEKYGIKVTFINPAFTSQEYNNCHYKGNRKKQEKFICKCCDKKLNADVNASRNIVARRSSNIEIYFKKRSVLNILINQFAESIKRLPRLYSKAKTLISSNHFFKDRQIRIDKVKLKYDIL